MASTDVAMLVPMSVAFVKDSILVDAFMPVTGIIYATGIHDKVGGRLMPTCVGGLPYITSSKNADL